MYNVAKLHYDNNTTPSLTIYSNKQEGKSVTGKVALIKFMDVVISSIAVIKNIATLYDTRVVV